jgi:hypothetical protein
LILVAYTTVTPKKAGKIDIGANEFGKKNSKAEHVPTMAIT